MIPAVPMNGIVPVRGNSMRISAGSSHHYSVKPLRVIIRPATGVSIEAIMLVAGRSAIRVAARHHDDAEEYRFRDWEWFSETGEPVEIESWEDGCRLVMMDGQVFQSAAHCGPPPGTGNVDTPWLN